jgi:hypothetical protein
MKLHLTKNFFLSLFILLFISKAQSQEGLIDFGPKVGANFSVLDTDNIDASEESITGLTAGLFLEVRLPTLLSFQAEVLYSEQGADLNSDVLSLSEEINLDYLQVPILGKFRFLKIANIHAGPQFGFLTNDVESDNFDIDTEDFDISAVAGVGVEIGKLRADLRYNFGLTETIESIEARNQYYSVAIGYEIF